ncbi:MAG: SusE domain-containing protein, partial [Bacteroidales bacterium]|nr:SusE domain-containing protein [Bacteroidales bacterium]
MKKLNLFVVVALLGIMFGCKDDPKEDAPVLSLVAPADGDNIDLNTGNSVTFKWKSEGAEMVGGYILYLGADAAMSNPAKFTESTFSRTFTAANLDATLGAENFGWKTGETGTLYWTVKPVSEYQNATLPEPRTLKVTRITVPPPEIVLQAPDDFLQLDAASYSFPLGFRWGQTSGITAYTLKISKESAFPATAATVTFEAGNTAEKSFTAEEWDVLLEGFDVDYEGEATLYWTVTPTDATVEYASGTRSIAAKRKPFSTIVLTSPADGLEINAEQEFTDRTLLPLSFTWEKLESVSGYVLSFSLSQDFSNPVDFNMIDANRKSFGDETFDDLLESLGVNYGATATLYWTVTPSGEAGEINTQVRTLQARRWDNTILVGTFAGTGTQLWTDRPAGWIQPSAVATPNQEVNIITEGHLGTLKTASLQSIYGVAFDSEGNMFATVRYSTMSGIVKINEADNSVDAVHLKLMAGGTGNVYTNIFCPNSIFYDAGRNRFLIAEETETTFEHFHTLDYNNGKWELNARQMSLADRKGLGATSKSVALVFDPSGSAMNAGGGKHNMVLHPQDGYIYGHINTKFYKAHPETFAAEIIAENVNNASTGVTKNVAFDPKNPDRLWFTSYHHANN